MPLTKTTTAIPLFTGIETKVDAKLVPATKLAEAINVSFAQEGAASLRYGSVSLPRTTTTGASIAAGTAVSAPNGELLMQDGAQLYSYGANMQTWVPKGPVLTGEVRTLPVLQNSATQSLVVSASNGTGLGALAAYAWIDSRGGVRYSIQDTNTGTFYIQDTQLTSTATRPQLVQASGAFYLMVLDGGHLHLYRVPLASPTLGFVLIQDVTSSLSGSHPLYAFAPSVASGDASTLLVAWLSTGSTLQVETLDENGNLLSSISYTGSFIAPIAMAVANESGGHVCMCMLDGFTIYFYDFDVVHSVIHSATASQNPAPVRCTVVAGAVVPFTVLVDTTPTTSVYPAILPFSVVPGETVLTVTAGTPFYGTQLASHAFVANGTVYALTSSLTTQPLNGGTLSSQTTFFLQDVNGVIYSRFMAGLAGGPPATSYLARPLVGTSSSAVVGVPQRVRFEDNVSDSTQLTVLTGVTSVTIDFTTATNAQMVPFGDLALVNGALPYSFDGGPLVESGFNAFPEDLTTSQASTGGNISAGTYIYFAVYEAVDSKGRWHRSTPGQVTVTVAAGNTNTVTVHVPYLPLTRWQAAYGRDNVFLSLFRSPANNNSTPTIANRVTALNAYANRVDGTYALAITDTLATVAANDFLYTSSGELPNDPPAALARVVEGKRRVFGISQENRLQVWYSKLLVADRPVEWSAAQIVSVESTGGDLTAIGELDEVLILFKGSRIYKVSGAGPNADGTSGDSFSFPTLISTTEGCIDPASVLKTDQGLCFKGHRGWSLLDHSLGIQYFGASVEAFRGNTCTGAAAVPTQAQTRFVTSSVAVIYDYVGSRWSTYQGMAAVGCATWGTTFVWLDSAGVVHQEVEGSYADDGAGVSATVTTAWLKPAQMAQGFARAYEIAVLGNYLSAHTLYVDLAYDYSPAWGYTLTFSPATAMNTETYGSTSPYGGETYGGDNGDNLYQFRSRLPRQRCESIRFRFRIANSTGAACQLNELALMFGTIGGLPRLPVSKTV